MNSILSKELCNTGRQIEFDIAKAVCILGMVFVHCYEEISAPNLTSSTGYYVFVIVLDALFGAATFMLSMGLGVAYTYKDNADTFIKRGIKIFILGYVLGFVRGSLPNLFLLKHGVSFTEGFVVDLLSVDIMQFAGLALILFGLLKKAKLSDKAIFVIALIMSIIGSFVRFLRFDYPVINELVGLLFGTLDDNYPNACSWFPLFNWFIIMFSGYLYGKALRHCKDIEKYYAISLPVSAVILAIYMFIAIPNRLGLMNDDIFYYYHMTSFDVIFCIIGMVFATSLYHYLSLILSTRVKKVISTISSNINITYCVHWVIIGWVRMLMKMDIINLLSTSGVFIFGTILFIVANLIAELFHRYRDKKL